MNKFILFLLCVSAQALTSVYLRDPAAGGSFTLTGCTNATPIVCTTSGSHGYSNGTIVAIYNVWGNYSANGLRKVKNVAPTTFELTDISNVNVAGVGTFCDPYTLAGVCSVYQGAYPLLHGTHATVSALGTYTLKDHPRVWLDGPGGTLTVATQDTSSTGRANTNNMPWNSILLGVSALEAGNAYLHGLNSGNANQPQNIGKYLSAAENWNALGGATELTVAKYAINHIEDWAGGTFGCDETINFCNRVNDVFFTSYYMPNLAQLYSLVRGQLSAPERAAFAEKMLNSNSTATNGWNGASSCTNQGMAGGTGTLSTSGSSTTVTLSGGSTAQLSAGNVLMLLSGGTASGYFVKVVSVGASTFTIDQAMTISAGTAFDISDAWATGKCGFIQMTMHHDLAPFGDPYNYAPDGSIGAYAEANIILHYIQQLIPMGIALADDDPRAVEMLAMAYAYYYDQMFGPIEKNMWTGFNQTNTSYSAATLPEAALIAAAITNSVSSPPDLVSGVYLQRMLAQAYLLPLPYDVNSYVLWGDPASPFVAPSRLDVWSFPLGLYPTTDEAKYANWWIRNQWGYWTANDINYDGGWHVGPAFIFMSPTATATDIVNAPKQYLFRATDQASCGAYGFTCPSYKQYGQVVSRTGLKTSTDTLAFFNTSDFYAGDHTGSGEAGELQIIKNAYLLGGDSQSNQFYDYFNGTTSVPEFGGSNVGLRGVNTDFFDNAVTRWAGVDPTGPSNNSYTYALAETVCNYTVASIGGCPAAASPTLSITSALRHVLHFKKAGQQDYVLQYDSWAASVGTTMRTYFHYALNGTAPATSMLFSGGSSGGTMRNTQASARLLTTFVTPAGANTAFTYVDNANGTYSGGQGYTFRVSVCAGNGSCNASATSFESIAIHKPSTNVSDTMPTISQLTATNFRVVQIADSGSPKVAAFSQGTSTYASLSFTSTFSGTGQYVIAGLTAGTYDFKVAGVTICGSQTVSAGDNTLYCEAAAGDVTVEVTGSGGGGITIGGQVTAAGNIQF